ncbi:hypothetical protein MPTK1_2g04940 [Marchantia polymorpha subsp. ruderalis]|uniref:Uncharacterized protein n=1 Tax=Marchantia polymorpha TaxID=3197 RepID=A0A2R6X7V5_MARPO|nr:hypothetical protein MARPO_0031s0149 [Marchantia polymorpha]BBN01135.1 hypothetical protein Mp_2g04940 [Marchantia polymorpha subsp. ruderalis]|eukprot:PTQ42184.1 hypothetical protein MARPO_0031s0149 [Marchantia polymorpha]
MLLGSVCFCPWVINRLAWESSHSSHDSPPSKSLYLLVPKHPPLEFNFVLNQCTLSMKLLQFIYGLGVSLKTYTVQFHEISIGP